MRLSYTLMGCPALSWSATALFCTVMDCSCTFLHCHGLASQLQAVLHGIFKRCPALKCEFLHCHRVLLHSPALSWDGLTVTGCPPLSLAVLRCHGLPSPTLSLAILYCPTRLSRAILHCHGLSSVASDSLLGYWLT